MFVCLLVPAEAFSHHLTFSSLHLFFFIYELLSANALSALQHRLSGTLSLSPFRTVTRSRYLNLDLKHICSPSSMLLNWPVRQRLWSHGNMALYKFCIVLYCSWGELQHLLPNLNALVAISKGIWAVKLCTNRSMQFLSGHSSLCWLTCIMAVKRVVGVCICVCSVCNRNLYLNESSQTNGKFCIFFLMRVCLLVLTLLQLLWWSPVVLQLYSSLFWTSPEIPGTAPG